MKLRFLKVTPSNNPEFPFQAGQIIHVEKLTGEMKRWLKEGLAVALPDSFEAASIADPERAVEGDPKRHS